MPFRIRITLIVLGVLAAVVVLLPLAWPVPPLEDTVAASTLRSDDALLVSVDGVDLHVMERSPHESSTAPTATNARASELERGADGAPDAGTAPSGFVFVHGFGSDGRSFGRVLDALSAAAPAVTYDRPGFGLSDRPLEGWERNPYGPEAQVRHLTAVMDHLGLERAVLVGNSAGAAIALRTALAHPERVDGLVLLAPDAAGSGGAPAATRWLLYTPQFERLGPLLMRRLGGATGESFLRAAYADPDRLPDDVLRAYREATTVHDWDRALWEVTQAGGEPDLRESLGRVEVPVLVLAGAEDPIVPAEDGRRLAEALPSARFVTVPDCGHRLQEECPAAVVSHTLAWWRSEGAGR